MSSAAPVTGLDPASRMLDSALSAVRAHVLADINPALELAVAGRNEDAELSDEVWRLVAEGPLDLLDIRGDGGQLAMSRATVAAEALATARQTFVMPLLLTALPSTAMLLAGGNDLDAPLDDLAAGRARAAFALSEPEAGSDLAAAATTARRDGSDYILEGRKAWVSATERTDWLLVLARTGEAGHRGLSFLLVEARGAGVRLAPRPPGLGMRSVPLCDVMLEGARVPADRLLGNEGGGFGLAMRILNAIRPLVAARGLGLTAAALMAATRYAESRSAFGATLADLQLVRIRLGELAARLEAARALTYHAAALVDDGQVGKESAPVLAAAKLVATELAVEAATTCLHVCGAAGYSEELPLARLLRDAQQLTLVEGVSEVQLELVARGLLERTLWWSTVDR
jgi:alkylation response protein AidB-like acyl-CoA dehydrogenase